MDASKLPKLKSEEFNTDGRPKNMPGIYKHKDSGATWITSPGETGTVQADALMAPIWEHAWERTGDVPSRLELIKMRKMQAMKDVLIEAKVKEEDEAEMVALEAEIKAEIKAGSKTPAKVEVDNPPPGTGVSF